MERAYVSSVSAIAIAAPSWCSLVACGQFGMSASRSGIRTRWPFQAASALLSAAGACVMSVI